MRTLFLADAHLRQETDDNYRLLVRFLAGLRGETETLYILGDLFDFWIGYPRSAFPRYLPLLESLEELKRSGTRIVYLEGNHDFHLGPVFTREIGVEVHEGPTEIRLGGKRIHLCHGDQINRRDRAYRLLRSVLRSSAVRRLISVVPPSIAFRIADMMAKKSKAGYSTRTARWDYETLLRNYAAERFAEGFDAVVAGHFHIPLIEESPSGKTVVSLGDWIGRFTYGEWSEGRFYLKTYLP